MRDSTLAFGDRPVIMGVLNVTPDSFYDGGAYADTGAAVRRAREMMHEGADIIDVGGESTRPKARPVSAQDELARIRPVVEALVAAGGIPISVDTRRASVAREVLEIGAHMINDVSGLRFDADMPLVIRDHEVPVVIMHMRGTPENMQDLTDYEDVVTDVKREIFERVEAAEKAGIDPRSIVIDPGIGFSKTAEQSVEIIGRLDEFLELGKPILIGPSRKSFIGKTLGLDKEDRLEATISCCIVGVTRGASFVRVHDVAPVSRALRMLKEIDRYRNTRKIGVPNRWNG
jgi:dihydropteroate synthase